MTDAGWWLSPTPLKNMKVSWDDYSQLNGKIKNVPNHQPECICMQHTYNASAFSSSVRAPGKSPAGTLAPAIPSPFSRLS